MLVCTPSMAIGIAIILVNQFGGLGRVSENPFNIGKFKVDANTRYVTDEEYKTQYDCSSGFTPTFSHCLN
jgi:hypothetical protein